VHHSTQPVSWLVCSTLNRLICETATRLLSPLSEANIPHFRSHLLPPPFPACYLPASRLRVAHGNGIGRKRFLSSNQLVRNLSFADRLCEAPSRDNDPHQWCTQDFRMGVVKVRRRRGGWGIPLPTGREVWGGGCALSPENVLDFLLKIPYLTHSDTFISYILHANGGPFWSHMRNYSIRKLVEG